MNVLVLAGWLLALPAAPRTVAECREVLERHATDPLAQVLRVEAVRLLGELGTPESTRVLEGLLADGWESLQDEAVLALGRLRRKDALVRRASVELLGEFLGRRRDPRTVRHLATALGLVGDRAAVPPLLAALRRSRAPEAIEALAVALATLGDRTALEPLREKARLSAPGRAACVRALGAFDGGAEAALGWIDRGDDDVRAAVVDALVMRGRDVLPDLEADARVGERFGIALADALAHVRDGATRRRRAAVLLGHESWRVRAAAIEAVGRLRDPVLLGDLVERLAVERGRLRVDLGNLLRRLTGRDLPDDPEAWRAILPVAELGDERGGGRRADGGFGLLLGSERLAFVVDASGGAGDEGERDRAREAFAAAVRELGPDQAFDVFVMRWPLEYPPRAELDRAFGRLRAGRVDEATRWLDGRDATGGGALFDALRAAMDDPDIDTICLFSGGVPSRGSLIRDSRILQEVQRHHRWRRVVIHAVLLGDEGEARGFLRELAEATGGLAVNLSGRRLAGRDTPRER